MNSSESVSLEGFEVFRDEIFTRAQVSSAKSKSKLENLVLEKWRTISLAQRLTYAETAKSFIKRKLETHPSSLSPSKKLKLDATIKKEPTIIDTAESVAQNAVANETPVPENTVVDNLEKTVEDSDRSVEYDEILSSGCHICKVKFKSVQNYGRHTKGKHSLVYISCKKCKMFHPQKSFKEHKCFKNNTPLKSSQNPGILQNISNQVNSALNKTEKDNSNKDQSQMKEHVEAPASEKCNTVNPVKEQVEKVWPDYIDAKSLKITGCPDCKQIIKSGKYSLHLMEVHKVQYKFVMNSKDGKVDPKYVLINKPAADGTQVSVKTEPVEQSSDFLKIQPKLNPPNVKITQSAQQMSDLARIQPRLNTTSVKTTEPVPPNLDLLKSQPKLNVSSVKTEPMEVEEVTSNEIVKANISEKDTTPKNIEKKSNVIKNINSRPKSKTSGLLESSLPKSDVKKTNKSKVNLEVTQEQETLNPKNILNDDEQIRIVQENLLIQEEQIRTVIFQTEALQTEANPMETTESSEADPLCDNVDNLGDTKDGNDRRSLLEVGSREDGNILNSNKEDLISRKISFLVDKLRSEIRQLLQEAKKKCLENPIVFSVDEDKDDNIGTDSKESNEDNGNDDEEGTEVTDLVLEECNDESNIDDPKNVNDKELDPQDVMEDSESREVGEDPQSEEFQEVEENSSNSLIGDADTNDQEDVEPTLDMEVTNENDDQINNQSDFNNYKKVISRRSSFSSASSLKPSKLIFQKPVINFSSSSDNEDISKQESDLNSYKMIMSGKNISTKKASLKSSASTDDEISSKIKVEEHASNKIEKEESTLNKIKEKENISNQSKEEENSSNQIKPSPKNEVSVMKANLPEKTEDNNNNTAAGKTKRRNPRINNNKNKITKKQSEKQENLNQAVSDVITYKLTPSEAVVKYKVTHSSLWMELVTNPADKQALARVGMAIEGEKKVVAAWQDLVRGLTGMEMMEKCENNTKEVMEYARFVSEEAGKEKVEVGEEWWLAFRKKHDLLWRKT